MGKGKMDRVCLEEGGALGLKRVVAVAGQGQMTLFVQVAFFPRGRACRRLCFPSLYTALPQPYSAYSSRRQVTGPSVPRSSASPIFLLIKRHIRTLRGQASADLTDFRVLNVYIYIYLQ